MSVDEYRCPMPTVRESYDETTDEEKYYLGVCGEPLYVERITTISITGGGKDGDATAVHDGMSGWEVKCHGRHCLLTHDTEDREAPILNEHLSAILNGLGALGCDYDTKNDYAHWPRVSNQ